jgi:hypothetical protein
MKFLKQLSILFMLAFSLFTTSLHSAPNSSFIYHPNGVIAWNFDAYSPFFHNNAVIAWEGIHNSYNRNFNYDNGKVAWKGYTSRQTTFSSDPCTVYHRNGSKLWQGAANKDVTFSYDPCTIYHSNRNIAWRGALNKETSFSYDPCTVYHRNGQAAWKGAYTNETASYDARTFYHANGQPAWRGQFSFENADLFASGVYHANGLLAWSGRYGDPYFNEYGLMENISTESISLYLGEDSWLNISSAGDRILNLSIGDGSYLQFSNRTEEPTLSVYLGPGYYLKFFPHSVDVPMLSCYEYNMNINY